jgi:hypothetical protein
MFCRLFLSAGVTGRRSLGVDLVHSLSIAQFIMVEKGQQRRAHIFLFHLPFQFFHLYPHSILPPFLDLLTTYSPHNHLRSISKYKTPDMATEEKPTVLIVGAGLGGLMLGVLLERIGFPYIIVTGKSKKRRLGLDSTFAVTPRRNTLGSPLIPLVVMGNLNSPRTFASRKSEAGDPAAKNRSAIFSISARRSPVGRKRIH